MGYRRRSGAMNGKALPDLLGRFDWSWDGKNPPKLLEYNADTPSMILESSDIQGLWHKEKFYGDKNKGQSNHIERALQDSLLLI